MTLLLKEGVDAAAFEGKEGEEGDRDKIGDRLDIELIPLVLAEGDLPIKRGEWRLVMSSIFEVTAAWVGKNNGQFKKNWFLSSKYSLN